VRQLPGPDHDEGQLVLETDAPSMVLLKEQGKTVRTLFSAAGYQVCDLKPGAYDLELGPGTPKYLRLSAQRVTVEAGQQSVVRVYRTQTPNPRKKP
jgi:hypothetical protein